MNRERRFGRTKVRPCTLKRAPLAVLGMLLTPVVFAASVRDFITERFRGPNVQVREVAKIKDPRQKTGGVQAAAARNTSSQQH